jgi:DNA-binding NarL/FixJ family response regulator
MLNVLLADDHQNMRKAISEILKNDAEVLLIGEASSFREVIALSSERRPDVVLMDVHMGDEQKVKLSELKACLTNCQLLTMSLWADQETQDLAQSLGAVMLLDKANLATELLPSLKLCAQRRSARNHVNQQIPAVPD